MARLSLMHGTLDLVVLGLLAGGVMHGYGIASLVHQRTGGELSSRTPPSTRRCTASNGRASSKRSGVLPKTIGVRGITR